MDDGCEIEAEMETETRQQPSPCSIPMNVLHVKLPSNSSSHRAVREGSM